MKPAIWRKIARRDVRDASFWYGRQAGLAMGERFLEAVEATIAHVAKYPASGSLGYAVQLQIEGLRFWAVDGFPYLVFYIEHEAQVDVWRVLHEKRDIPAWMKGTA